MIWSEGSDQGVTASGQTAHCLKNRSSAYSWCGVISTCSATVLQMKNMELVMKTLLLIAGLFAFSLTTVPAFAGSCGGGDHTHTTEDNTNKRKGTGI